jgi:hypothetical protein
VETWVVSLILMAVATAVVVWMPGAPVRGTNRIIFTVAAALIGIGYLLLAQGPADNPVSLTWAPLLLVAAYVILIPISLIRRQNGEGKTSE